MFSRRPAGWFLLIRISPIIQRKGQPYNPRRNKANEGREETMESRIAFSVSEPEEKRKAREQCLDYLSSHRIGVGLPSSASARSKALLAIHEHGAPAMRIPARPVLRPALSREETRAAMAAGMVHACAAAQKGDMEGTKAGLAEAGQAGADGIRAYIDKGVPPPNAPITLEGGWMRNPESGKPVYIKGKSGTTPLVDTGQLYEEFGWEIGEK